MRKGFLGSLTALLAGAGLALGEAPAPPENLPDGAAHVALAPVQDAGPGQGKKADGNGPKAERIAAPNETAMPREALSIQEQMPMLSGRAYGGVEYLLWSTKGDRLPPLATTGPDLTLNGTAPAGVLGQNGTVTLFGEQSVLTAERSGARFSAGYWLDSIQSAAIEASGFILSPGSQSYTTTSSNGTILARPFINPNISTNPLQAETALLLGASTQTGSFAATMRNEVWGAEVNTRWNVKNGSWYRADLLVGLRYAQVKDSLLIADSTTAQPGSFVAVLGHPFVAQSSANFDSLTTRNDFYGAQIGTHIEMKNGNWFLDVTGKLAMGVMFQHLDINGQTSATNVIGAANPGTVVFPGGVFAQPGQNIGPHSRDEFAVVPELGMIAGYQIGCHARVFVGYNILYFRTDIIRPGTQIDRIVVTPGSIVKPPAFSLKDQDFWAQGFTTGVEISF